MQQSVPAAAIATTAPPPPPPILLRIGSSGTGLNWTGATGSSQRTGLSGTGLSWVGLGRTGSSGIGSSWTGLGGTWSVVNDHGVSSGALQAVVGLCLLWSCCCRLSGHLNRGACFNLILCWLICPTLSTATDTSTRALEGRVISAEFQPSQQVIQVSM